MNTWRLNNYLLNEWSIEKMRAEIFLKITKIKREWRYNTLKSL